MARRSSRRYPLLAAALSVVVPGLGDWYVGRRRRAVLFLSLSVLIVAGLVVLWRLDATRILELAVQPRVLWTLLVLNVLVGVFRLFAVADVYRAARPAGRSRRRAFAGATAVLALIAVTAAPHVMAGAYTVEALDLLTAVFVDDEVESTVADDLLFRPRGPIIEVVPRIYLHRPPDEWRPYEDPPPSGRFPLQDVQAPAPFHTEGLDDDRITILLAGGDAGPGRSGLRTDVMMVASLDLETGSAAIFGIPRHIRGLPLPKVLQDSPFLAEHYNEDCECFLGKTNAIHPFATWDGGLFRGETDPGMKALEITVERLLDIPIDYYMLVDMAGFVDVVDALGGVTVNVLSPVVAEVSPYEVDGEWIAIELEPGRQHLDGPEALAYVRERQASSDYARMRRQRCMLEAIAAEATPTRMVRAFPRLSQAIKRSATTNIPLGVLPDLVSAAADLRFEDITTLGLNPPYYVVFDEELGLHVFHLERVQRTVRNILAGRDPSVQPGVAAEC